VWAQSSLYTGGAANGKVDSGWLFIINMDPTMNRPAHRATGFTLVLLFAVLGALIFFPLAALAADKQVAVYVEGPDANLVRQAIIGALGDRLKVVDANAFARSLAKQGQRGQFGANLTAPKQRGKPIAKLRAAGKAAGADVVLAGRTQKKAGKLTVHLLWIEGTSGDPSIDEDIAQSGDAKAKKDSLKQALGSSVDRLVGGGAPSVSGAPGQGNKGEEPSGDGKDGERASDDGKDEGPGDNGRGKDSKRPKNQYNRALFIVGLGVEISGRTFSYTDLLTQNGRDYNVVGVPVPSFMAEIYPLAASSVPIVRDLGIAASYAHAFGIQSQTKDGVKVDTTWDRLFAGLRLRFRLGDRESSPMLGVHGGFGLQRFELTTADKVLAASVPSTSYTLLRGGIDARIPIWRFAMLLDANYDAPLSAGAVYDRFTGSHVGGVDFAAGLSFSILKGLEARAVAQYSRYFYSFDPQPGDAYVAGGALDELYALNLGVAYAF
jgi:hypothetical protein